MWDYIVMGQIPGTSVQVTFLTWLFITASLVLVSLIFMAVRSTFAGGPQNLQEVTVSHSVTVRKEAKRNSLPLAVKLLVAVRISHAMQKAAYGHWLVARHQIQA